MYRKMKKLQTEDVRFKKLKTDPWLPLLTSMKEQA